MTQVINQNWYDQNSDRAYPLVDFATRLDTTATFELPNDVIVDARLVAPPNLDSTKFYIRQIAAFGAGMVLTVAVDGVADVASVTVPLAGFEEFTAYTVSGLPGYTDVGGSFVFGTAASVIAAASGNYTFTLAATRLVPTIIFPAAPSVTSITVVDAFGAQTRLTGAVTLQAGDNVAIDVDGQTIEVELETGVLIEDPCPCTDTGGRARTAVKSINGVTPDESGNLEIIPVGCVDIEAGTNQLALKDTCAQPCCGTAEIQILEAAARDIQSILATQANKSADLESALRSLQNFLVG
jgi:hypothetical protein